jgi:putative heme-binding domain-containing protein
MIMGKYVGAADRFESFRPGYQVVKDQLDTPRRAVPVLSAGVTPDNCSIVLQTVPLHESVSYALTVPEPAGTGETQNGARAAVQETCCSGEIDLLANLNGVTAKWTSASGKAHWNGWLPHLDLAVARHLTGPSLEHRRLFQSLKQRGTLNLRLQLDLSSMLHPAVQPGQKLGYEYPPEVVTVVLKSDRKLELKKAGGTAFKQAARNEWHLTVPMKTGNWIPLDITLTTTATEPKLEAAWFTAEDARLRPFPLRRFYVPWASPARVEPVLASRGVVPELVGGDRERGRQVFLSEAASCSKCHQVGGEGGKLGPDLSSLSQRDYASVLKDILEPSAAINPDHLAYNFELKDGSAFSGVILDETAGKIVLGQISGKSVTLERDKIAKMTASSVSFMPEGLFKTLSARQQKDLLTFLLTAPANRKLP